MPARRYASAGTSYGPVSVDPSVCLPVSVSVTSRCSIERDGLIYMVLARRLLSTSPTRKFRYLQNKGTSLLNLFLNSAGT